MEEFAELQQQISKQVRGYGDRIGLLEELLATWKPNHPDVLRLKAKYGEGIQFSTIAHRSGVKPQFELSCYKLKKLKGA